MKSLADDRRVEVVNPRHLHLAYADALRAAAILIVVLQHLILLSAPITSHGRPLWFSYLGIWGVNCFFVLSGYLLGRPYVAMLLDSERKMPSSKLFYARRFLRIYPLYAVAVFASTVLVYLTSGHFPSLADLGAHVFMLHTFSTSYATSLNGPLWTMAVDAEFYALLPIVAALLAFALRGRSARARRRAVLGTLAAIFVGSIAFHYEMLVRFPATVHDFTLAVVLIRNVIGFSGTFAVGLFLAFVALRYEDRIPQRPALFLSLVGLGAAIAIVQLFVRTEPVGMPSDVQIVWLACNEALAAVSVALVFFGLSEGKLPFLTRLTGSKVVTSLAALSYAVYLIHWPVLDGISAMLRRPEGPTAFLELAALASVVVTIFAYALHVAIERPVLRVKDDMRERPTFANAAKDRVREAHAGINAVP